MKTDWREEALESHGWVNVLVKSRINPPKRRLRNAVTLTFERDGQRHEYEGRSRKDAIDKACTDLLGKEK